MLGTCLYLKGFNPRPFSFSTVRQVRLGGLRQRSFHGLVVKAATVVAPKYTNIKPLGDRVLVKIKEAEEKTESGILLPTTAQTKPQGGEVVAIGVWESSSSDGELEGCGDSVMTTAYTTYKDRNKLLDSATGKPSTPFDHELDTWTLFQPLTPGSSMI